MRPATALFDSLAPVYDRHFSLPHRRLYDDLAWERVRALLPDSPGVVVDAGCGTGRWAPRLVALGHRVIGVELAPAMARASEQRARRLPRGTFTVVEGDMATVELPSGGADAVIAMGSLQYTSDPAAVLRRFAGWLRPGGHAAVLVDSLVGLVAELLSTGLHDEALERLRTRTGRWAPADAPGRHAELHLFDRDSLVSLFEAADFSHIVSAGLLVATMAARRAGGDFGMADDDLEHIERSLAAVQVLADSGKHLLVSGRVAAMRGG